MSEEKLGNKEWQKPELVVLVRTKPEEAVLAACKESSEESSGPNNYNNRCQIYEVSYCPNDQCSIYIGT